MRKSLLSLATLAVAAVCLLATSAAGAPYAEKKFTASGGWRICAVNANGPLLIEARAEDDTATVYFADTIQVTPTVTLRREWPDSGLGYFKIYPGEPRPFYFSAGEADTIYVDIGGATEVHITCTREN